MMAIKIFMLIIKFYEFLENNYYNTLTSEINMILPKKLEIIFNYFENFEIPIVQHLINYFNFTEPPGLCPERFTLNQLFILV